MEQKERESDNIELRSEKVRNVIGKVPPRLVSLGIKEQCKCLCHTSICIFSISQGLLMYLSRAMLMHLITATS